MSNATNGEIHDANEGWRATGVTIERYLPEMPRKSCSSLKRAMAGTAMASSASRRLGCGWGNNINGTRVVSVSVGVLRGRGEAEDGIKKPGGSEILTTRERCQRGWQWPSMPRASHASALGFATVRGFVFLNLQPIYKLAPKLTAFAEQHREQKKR